MNTSRNATPLRLREAAPRLRRTSGGFARNGAKMWCAHWTLSGGAHVQGEDQACVSAFKADYGSDSSLAYTGGLKCAALFLADPVLKPEEPEGQAVVVPAAFEH